MLEMIKMIQEAEDFVSLGAATKEQIGLMMTSSDFVHSSPRPGETISQAEAMVAKSKEVRQND